MDRSRGKQDKDGDRHIAVIVIVLGILLMTYQTAVLLMTYQTAAPDVRRECIRLFSTTNVGAVRKVEHIRGRIDQRVQQIEDCSHQLKADNNRFQATCSN